MKYRISTIGKNKSNYEDLITRKYFKRIRDIELNPVNGEIFLLGEHALWKLSR